MAVECPLARGKVLVEWRLWRLTCAGCCCFLLSVLLYTVHITFPGCLPLLDEPPLSHFVQFFTFSLNVALASAIFPYMRSNAAGSLTSHLTAATCLVVAANLILIFVRTCSKTHPCWRVVVTFSALMNGIPMCVCMRLAAGFDIDFWKEIRVAIALAGCFQIVRTLLLLALLGDSEHLFPPRKKSFAGATAYGCFLLLVALITKPSFRMGLSNACGIASVQAMRLADLCLQETPLSLNLEFESNHDDESIGISEYAFGSIPTKLTAFSPHRLECHLPARTASSRSNGSLGTLASSDDFSPSTFVLSSHLPPGSGKALSPSADEDRVSAIEGRIAPSSCRDSLRGGYSSFSMRQALRLLRRLRPSRKAE